MVFSWAKHKENGLKHQIQRAQTMIRQASNPSKDNTTQSELAVHHPSWVTEFARTGSFTSLKTEVTKDFDKQQAENQRRIDKIGGKS